MHANGGHTPGTRQIVDVLLVQVSEVKNANHMEPEELRRSLHQVLKEDGLSVGTLATDRHIMVGSLMKKEFPHVTHQYNVWHVAKRSTKSCQMLLT